MTATGTALGPNSIALAVGVGLSAEGVGIAPVTASLAIGVGATAVAHATIPGTATFAVGVGLTAVDSAFRLIVIGPPDPPPDVQAPNVLGPNDPMELVIGGTSLSLKNMEHLASIQSQTIGRWSASVTLFDNSGTVATLFNGANGGVGLSITIQEFGQKLFAGCVQQVVATRFMGTTSGIRYQITATDKSGICDRRVVKTAKYTADQDAADVVRDIVTNYLNGEGITTANVPATLGALGSDTPFNFQTVKSAFDQIATLTATVWWVDINGDLHFSALADLPPAPFSISETSENWRGLNDGDGPSVTTSLQDFATDVIVVSNLNVVPDQGSSTSGTQVEESYTVPQAAATALGLASGYIVLNLPIGSVVSLKVNGVAKTMYSYFDPAAPPYGSADVWYYFGPGALFVFPGFAPSAGVTIDVVYVPNAGNASVGPGEALAPPTPGLGTCGSGKYERVFQVQDVSLRSDLDALAAAYLAEYNVVPQQIDFQTDFHGLQPGQLLDINIPLISLGSKQFLVTAVSGTSTGSDLGHGCSFHWNVTARSNQDPGNWVKWFERFIRRTEQAKPIVQIERHEFILDPGSSVSGAAPATNPVGVKQAGKLYRKTVIAGTPPVDQDLLLTFKVNGLPVGTITLHSTDTANVVVSEAFDDAMPQYVYTDDVETIDSLYINVGGSAVPAKDVIAALEHTV